ncbi:3-hydroxyacyl-ACP dehydratase FabZ family protein [Paenibacillus sambharensis]|nr:FabA-like domain protein [Paenibacillus sambharensis]
MRPDLLRELPYKKPWIFVDRIISCIPSQQISTLKNITSSDFFLRGHFPSYSVFPGMLLLEGIKQSCELLVKLSGYEPEPEFLQAAQLQIRLLKPSLPGDTVVYSVKWTAEEDGRMLFSAEGKIEGVPSVRCTFRLAADAVRHSGRKEGTR